MTRNWRLDAACASPEVDPEWFFDPKGYGLAGFTCARCPVQDACLTETGTDFISFSAGMTPSEKRERVTGSPWPPAYEARSPRRILTDDERTAGLAWLDGEGEGELAGVDLPNTDLKQKILRDLLEAKFRPVEIARRHGCNTTTVYKVRDVYYRPPLMAEDPEGILDLQ